MTELTDTEVIDAAAKQLAQLIILLGGTYNIECCLIMTLNDESAIVGNKCPVCSLELLSGYVEDRHLEHIETTENEVKH